MWRSFLTLLQNWLLLIRPLSLMGLGMVHMPAVLGTLCSDANHWRILTISSYIPERPAGPESRMYSGSIAVPVVQKYFVCVCSSYAALLTQQNWFCVTFNKTPDGHHSKPHSPHTIFKLHFPLVLSVVGCWCCAMARSLDRQLLIAGQEHWYCKTERERELQKQEQRILWPGAAHTVVMVLSLITQSEWMSKVHSQDLISKQLIMSCNFCV